MITKKSNNKKDDIKNPNIKEYFDILDNFEFNSKDLSKLSNNDMIKHINNEDERGVNYKQLESIGYDIM